MRVSGPLWPKRKKARPRQNQGRDSWARMPGGVSLSAPGGKQVTKSNSDSFAYPPRGLSRDEAARYVGVSTTKFDQLVADRRMPKPRKIDRRSVWDRVQLDIAFSDLPQEDEQLTEIQRVLEEARAGYKHRT